MKQIIVCAVCCAVLSLLPGCSVGPVEQAGGDDFPNMIASAGKTITENLDQTWENPAEASSAQLSVIDKAAQAISSIGNPLGKKSVLNKRTACNDSTWFSLDLSNGYLTAFIRKCTDTTTKYDTIMIAVNGEDTILVSLAGASVQTVPPYSVLLYHCEDLDGDSVLYRAGGEQQLTRIVFPCQYLGGRIETIDIGYDGGSDGNFMTGDDNDILFASATVTLGGDTISFISLNDADGDGYIASGNAASDSSIVDMFIMTGRNDLLPWTVSTTASRMVLFPEDSTKNYAIRYRVTDQFATRIIRSIIQTTNGDSTFYPGDTVEVIRSTQPLSGDSLEADTLIMQAILGEAPNDSLDDLLIGIYLHSKFQRGDDREVILDYHAQTMIPAGGKPHDGTLYFKIITRNDAWIEVNGSIDETTINADVETSGGKRYTVKWDIDGKVLSLTEL